MTGVGGRGPSSAGDPPMRDRFSRIVRGPASRLTWRQLEALRAVYARGSGVRGVSLREVAAQLKIQPPSALAHLGRLEDLGLVRRSRGKSWVTRKGRRCLREYQRRHRVAETLLFQAGLPAEATHDAALEMDLALTPKTVNEVCSAEGHPSACPHGFPITHPRRLRLPRSR
jgi:Mn-dependent DtxR family transcriptional regulator